jgi:Domain of unknown function (DUF397)
MSGLDGAVWRKSTYSALNGCAEVAFLPDGRVAMRDSKQPHAGALVFTPAEWRAFLDGVRAGEFDLPAD